MQGAPQNGIKGLKHWRFDLLAGMQVALVSLPLSLGIAIASGAPPVTGLISAIIAGLVFPFLGGAYVTISGPAAGLAPALLAGMLLLGGGDLAAGYPLLLVAICLTGLIQIVLAFCNAGRFAIFLPVTVVEGMLAAIGLIIIIKQIPPLMGVILPAASSMLASMAKIPQVVMQMQWEIFLIGALSLFFMFYLNLTRNRWLRKLPAALFVAILGIVLGYVFKLDTSYLITMPENILEGSITWPAFSEVMNRPDLWWGVLVVVITLTLIDGVESLATIKAVDKIDPFQRKSDPNVTLRAMGVSNTVSSIFGGLTIIPGGIKSRTNIDAGGRTLWANFYNAVFLLIFLFLATDIIARVPLASIAAILIYVGWKLCEFKVFTKTYAIGRDQLVIFFITIVSILASDLLTGILIGIAAEVLMLLYLLMPSFRFILTGRLTVKTSLVLLWQNLSGMFRTPVINIKEIEGGEHPHYELSLSSVVCFNLLPLDKTLNQLPANAAITLVITESGRIMDHTGVEYLHQFEEECVRDGRAFELKGMDNFFQFTNHSLSARMQDASLIKEEAKLSARELEMAAWAEQYGLSFYSQTTSILNNHDFVYLRRGADKESVHLMSGEYRGCSVQLFDYSHTAAPDYYAKHWHTLMVMKCPLNGGQQLPDFVVAPDHYLQRYLVEFEEIDLAEKPQLAKTYRLYGRAKGDSASIIFPELFEFLVKYPDYYLEVRNGVVLAFRPSLELGSEQDIAQLFQLADVFNVHCESVRDANTSAD